MAAVTCWPGNTQIIGGLHKFLQDERDDKAGAVILIGDCFEEDPATARRIGALLKRKKIKVLSFIEGNGERASRVFRRLAADAGGKFARFGADLPLADLCEGVALLASGGQKALARLDNEKARLLLTGPTGSK